MAKTKCNLCKKKLELVKIIQGTCRCGNIYCYEHILQHSCKFDYKTLQKEKIIQENPQILSDKINKI